MSVSRPSALIFTVEVNDDGTGSYKFTLKGVLDHSLAGEDAIKLNFAATAKDADGDATPVHFEVSVLDDKPVDIGAIQARTVEEEELSGGNEDTSGTGDRDKLGDLINQTTASTGGSLKIAWGADNADAAGRNDGVGRSVAFASEAAASNIHLSNGNGALLALAGLTSDGLAITYTLSDHSTKLTVSTSTGTVFTVNGSCFKEEPS